VEKQRDAGYARAKAFDAGGLLSRRDAYIWLAQHVQSLWQIEGVGTLVVQDVWAKPTDVAVQQSGLHLNQFFHGESVYYFLRGMNADFRSLQSVVRAVTSYLFVAFFSHIDVRPDALAPDRQVGEDMITNIGRSIREVFVSAYDQEGLVMWRGADRSRAIGSRCPAGSAAH
jgi:hypothetical protein